MRLNHDLKVHKYLDEQNVIYAEPISPASTGSGQARLSLLIRDQPMTSGLSVTRE